MGPFTQYFNKKMFVLNFGNMSRAVCFLQRRDDYKYYNRGMHKRCEGTHKLKQL